MKKKALIVDDEEQARLYLAKMIAVSFPDMEILFAATPEEALFVLERNKTDILFLDVEMPGMSGLEMLQTLRDKLSELPVIVVSGYNRVEYLKKAIRLNVVDYLNKPVDPDELELAVNKAFDGNPVRELIPTEHKISLNTERGTMIVAPEKLLYLCTQKRSSIIIFADDEKDVIVHDNLMSLEKSLTGDIFKRVSRQCIINVNYLILVKKERKELTLKAKNKEVKLSKIYPKIIRELTK